MQLTDHLIKFIDTEARRRKWVNPHTNEVSVAELARNSNFSEATWSRIMRKKQKTIKDSVVASIGEMFGASPIDMLIISAGERSKNLSINQDQPIYHDRHDRLAQWIRSTATPKAVDTIYNIAELAGFEESNPAKPKS